MSRIKDYLMDIEEGRIVLGEIQVKSVCAEHFDSTYLQNYINENGSKGECSYCGKCGKVLSMPDFIRLVRRKIESEFDDVDDAGLPTERSYFDDDEEKIPGLKRFFGYTAPSYAKCYEDTSEVLDDIGLLPEPEALYYDLLESLPNHAWISSDPFIISRDKELSLSWNNFAEMVKHRQRFTFWTRDEFSGVHSEYDNCMMDILHELGSLVHEANLCKMLEADVQLFRARPIKEDTPLEFKEITSSPDNKASQNRMSPAGISMFYGSFDEETARLETSSNHDGQGRFLIGRFHAKNPLLILDLTKIPKPLFWEQGQDYREQLIFLNRFSKEISKPIDKDDKNYIEYVPTQVFTEYLRYVFKYYGKETLDGLKYCSSINNHPCIVLFCNQKESENELIMENVDDITIV